MRGNKAFIFYFLMNIILLDFGNHLRKIFQNPYLAQKINNDIFTIFNVNNTGSAFSLFQNNAKTLAIFGIVAVVFIAFYVFKFVSFEDKNKLLSLTIFSAGALGNAIERLNYGYVIDYVKLNFIDFPVFNAFDIMICIGIGLYCLSILLDLKHGTNKN